jgi:integrase
LADSKRRRGRSFGSIRKLASGRWQARYHDATGRRHTAPQTFATKTDAARYLATIQADMLRGAWTDPSLRLVTFAQWVQRWRVTATELRPSTIALYDYLLRRFLLPAFANIPLGQLDLLAVRGWLARLHRDGEVTPTTIAKAYRLLRRILAVAVQAGYLPRNPCTVTGAGVERVREMRHLSVPELLRLAGLVPDRYRAMVLLAGFGGLRWGELVGLRRRHLNLAHATVTVAGQVTEVGGRFIAGPPKTNAGLRTIPLPMTVMTALVEHLDRHAQPGPDGLLFSTNTGSYLQRGNFSRQVWQPAVARARLEGLRFHDLRHTAATLAAATGATTRELMQRLGHATPAMALRYQHVMADRQAALAAALDGLVRQALQQQRTREGTPRARQQGRTTREDPLQAASQHQQGSGRRESNPHRELGKLEFYH